MSPYVKELFRKAQPDKRLLPDGIKIEVMGNGELTSFSVLPKNNFEELEEAKKDQ